MTAARLAALAVMVIAIAGFGGWPTPLSPANASRAERVMNGAGAFSFMVAAFVVWLMTIRQTAIRLVFASISISLIGFIMTAFLGRLLIGRMPSIGLCATLLFFTVVGWVFIFGMTWHRFTRFGARVIGTVGVVALLGAAIKIPILARGYAGVSRPLTPPLAILFVALAVGLDRVGAARAKADKAPS